LTHQALPERAPRLTDEGVYRGPGARWSDVFAYADETRLAWHMDARGVRTVLDYADDGNADDPLGRLHALSYEPTSTVHPGNPDPADPPAPASAVRYEYVTTGDLTRPIRVTTDNTVEEYGYDDQGRLASKTLTLPSQTRLGFVIGYGYDDLDRLRSITYPAQHGLKGSPRKHVELVHNLAAPVLNLA